MQKLVPWGKESSLAKMYRADMLLIESWLHDKGEHTQRAYQRDVRLFFELVEKPLQQVTLRDVQHFDDSLKHLADTTRARSLATIKSLLSFAEKTGYLSLNVGAALKLPKAQDTLAERLLSDQAIVKMLALEADPRNHALLALLYNSAIRRAELCGLHWKDVQARPELQTGQVSVFGKGRKTRAIVLKSWVWEELQTLRGDAPDEASVFGIEASQVYKIVKKAAERAGLKKSVSPHWFRHAHATHALNRGAPISLVSATLGHANVAITGRYTHVQPDDSSANYLPI